MSFYDSHEQWLAKEMEFHGKITNPNYDLKESKV